MILRSTYRSEARPLDVPLRRVSWQQPFGSPADGALFRKIAAANPSPFLLPSPKQIRLQF